MKLMFMCVLNSLGRDWPKVITGWQLLSGDQFRMNWWIPFCVEWIVFCEGSWWCNHSMWNFSSGELFIGSGRQSFLHSSANYTLDSYVWSILFHFVSGNIVFTWLTLYSALQNRCFYDDVSLSINTFHASYLNHIGIYTHLNFAHRLGDELRLKCILR